MKTIVCYGDSNTHGHIACTDSRYPPESRWPRVMAASLGAEYDVVEEGLGGRTTVFDDPLREGMSGLAHLTPILKSHKPISTLIIMLGTNDTKERFAASAHVIGLGMRRLLEKAMELPVWADGPDIVLAAPVPIDPAYMQKEIRHEFGAGCAAKSAELAVVYRKLAMQFGLRFFNAGVHAQPNPLDGVHLAEDGHRQIGTAMADMLLHRGGCKG